MSVELTRDAKSLLKALYSAYQDRIADGVKKDTAKYFSDAQAIYDTVYAQQDPDDLVDTIRELSRVGIKVSYPKDNQHLRHRASINL